MTTQPPAPLLAATTDLLRRYAPFDAMAPGELELLASRLKLRYFAQGERILSPASGVVRSLYIVQRGVVDGVPATFPSFHAKAFRLGEGESFPIGALIGQRASTVNYDAAADTFCYLLDEADFRAVMAASPAFHAFCTQRLANLLEQSAREVQARFAARAEAEMGMGAALATAVRRPPVTLPASASVHAALTLMKSLGVGSVVLTGANGSPEGIFTRADVLDRVALASLDAHGTPVSAVMTPDPIGLPADAALAEAAELMARHGIRHLLVREAGRLVGVVSERDLFALQRRSVQGLRKQIAGAESAAALAAAAHEAAGLGRTLLAQGVGAESLIQLVTAMNDAIALRAVELGRARHGLDGVAFCWMGLGSEGRREQTLATDQDNAIVFADPWGRVPNPSPTAPMADSVRERLLAFAAEVNDTLDASGFPLCKGAIMARNPRWCLSLGEWQDRFDDWMRNADPEALMNAAIFFDFRALAGDESLTTRLREFLLANVVKRPAFLRQMAANALEVRIPLGIFDDVGVLDLKLHASRPFVDAARILALAAGVAATSTAQRLREAGPAMRMGADEVAVTVQAFQFVQMLRLRRQEEARMGEASREPNRVDAATLNSLDRRILKEALRQARKLQNRIALEYQL